MPVTNKETTMAIIVRRRDADRWPMAPGVDQSLRRRSAPFSIEKKKK